MAAELAESTEQLGAAQTLNATLSKRERQEKQKRARLQQLEEELVSVRGQLQAALSDNAGLLKRLYEAKMSVQVERESLETRPRRRWARPSCSQLRRVLLKKLCNCAFGDYAVPVRQGLRGGGREGGGRGRGRALGARGQGGVARPREADRGAAQARARRLRARQPRRLGSDAIDVAGANRSACSDLGFDSLPSSLYNRAVK